MTRFLLGICVLWLFTACQSGEPGPEMKRAFELHEVAVKKHDSLKNELSAIRPQDLNQTEFQKWEELKDALTKWEGSVVEVPGFEHDHDHDHGHEEGDGHDHDHDHDHDAASEAMKDLPPTEMLKYQQALLDEIQRLFNETKGLAKLAAEPSSEADSE